MPMFFHYCLNMLCLRRAFMCYVLFRINRVLPKSLSLYSTALSDAQSLLQHSHPSLLFFRLNLFTHSYTVRTTTSNINTISVIEQKQHQHSTHLTSPRHQNGPTLKHPRFHTSFFNTIYQRPLYRGCDTGKVHMLRYRHLSRSSDSARHNVHCRCCRRRIRAE